MSMADTEREAARKAGYVPLFGTGPKSDCQAAISGATFTVGLFRDGSALRVSRERREFVTYPAGSFEGTRFWFVDWANQ